MGILNELFGKSKSEEDIIKMNTRAVVHEYIHNEVARDLSNEFMDMGWKVEDGKKKLMVIMKGPPSDIEAIKEDIEDMRDKYRKLLQNARNKVTEMDNMKNTVSDMSKELNPEFRQRKQEINNKAENIKSILGNLKAKKEQEVMNINIDTDSIMVQLREEIKREVKDKANQILQEEINNAMVQLDKAISQAENNMEDPIGLIRYLIKLVRKKNPDKSKIEAGRKQLKQVITGEEHSKELNKALMSVDKYLNSNQKEPALNSLQKLKWSVENLDVDEQEEEQDEQKKQQKQERKNHKSQQVQELE